METIKMLDIDDFISYKPNKEVQELDTKTLELLNSLFGLNDKYKKSKKYIKKQSINILKSQKVQNKKDNIINKVNLILNKLSETNIDNLVLEFLENINQVDEDNFDEIQKTIYIKILSEINFCKIYLDFLKIIGLIYNKVQNYSLNYFISIIELKFKTDYTNFNIDFDEKYNILKELEGETKRFNNLVLLKSLFDNKMLSKELEELCDNLIIEQNIYLPDIYHWFNLKNIELSDQQKTIIKKHIIENVLSPRENVLLESLLTTNEKFIKQTNETNPQTNKNIIKNDTLLLECDNIIEEYILLKSIEDINYFINTRCIDAISKNKFCEVLIDKYFSGTKESSRDLVDLIKELLKNQILFKSNISRGLLLIYGNWKERTIDYEKPQLKMKNLLITLKSIGVKGIENLFTTFNIL